MFGRVVNDKILPRFGRPRIAVKPSCFGEGDGLVFKNKDRHHPLPAIGGPHTAKEVSGEGNK